MKDLLAVDDKDTLKYVVRHELKSFGIKIPKEKRSSVRCTSQGKERTSGRSTVFGCPLDEIPAVPLNSHPGSAVPKFLVDCVQFLQDNIDCEGLFRKPGSRARQKDLQRIIENEGPIPTDAHVHDVAGLFKFFFRELPEPLLSGKLAEALLKCQQLPAAHEVHYTTQLLCLGLPSIYCHTLRYAMQFLKEVAGSVSSNKMDASNLALVMTPNLMGGFKVDKSGGTSATEKLLRLQTAVVRHLIEKAENIGMVPDAVAERVESYGNRSGSDLLTDRLTSEDELDKSGEGTLEPEERKKNRRRRRSGQIQGIMSGIGQSLGILKSGAGSTVSKTPAMDEVIENPSFLGETPRILRSSKRKASEDLGTFSSAKRKAMLHQMTTDPQYSKPGMSLHREGRQGIQMAYSPITPLRPSGPALGEVDAVTEDGATVFKFQTPSIKFADESFTTFCATPPGKEGIASATPGKKMGKLNPLSSKKYKRRSGVIQADVSTTPRSVYSSYTPKSGSVYRSIKKKLGHRHTRTQPTPIELNDMPDKSVGWRLANPPEQEDPAALDGLALGNSPRFKKTPLSRRGRQRRQKTPSSPATLFSSRPVISHPVQRSQFKGQMPCAIDFESPTVVVVDLKSNQSHNDVSDVYLQDGGNQPICKDEDDSREGLAKSGVDSRDMYEDVSQITKNGSSWIESPQLDIKDKGSLRSDRSMDLTSSDSPNVEAYTEATGHRQLQQSGSQKSLSSVLSQVSMDSTKSVFSVEIDYETASFQAVSEDANDVTVQNDETLKDTCSPVELEYSFQLDADDTQIHVQEIESVLEDVDCGISKNGQYNSCDENDEIDGLNGSNEYLGQAGSILSLDSAVSGDGEYTGSLDSLKCTMITGQSGRLVKSVSVDSGKGLSLDNLASFDEAKLQEAIERRIASERGIKSAQEIPQGLVKMMSERLSPVDDASEESSCSVSSEDNPQYRETKAFWKLARTGHIFNKSLSDSQVNSPARRIGPKLSSPIKSYHSQVHIAKDRLGQKPIGKTLLNLSNVKSNIDKFNSLCLEISPVNNVRSRSVHKCSPEAEQLSSKGGLAEPTRGETSKQEPTQAQPKTSLVKSISIDSGMCNIGISLSVSETEPFSIDHDDSFEMALSLEASVDFPRGLQNAKDDIDMSKPVSSKSITQYENAEEMPVHHDGSQDIDQIPEHLAPVHALHNEALTPLKLASSTIIRSPGKRALKIKHRSPLQCLKIPNNQDFTPMLREARTHKRYPCSPKNPLFRQQAGAKQERSLIPSHVRDDLDVVEL